MNAIWQAECKAVEAEVAELVALLCLGLPGQRDALDQAVAQAACPREAVQRASARLHELAREARP